MEQTKLGFIQTDVGHFALCEEVPRWSSDRQELLDSWLRGVDLVFGTGTCNGGWEVGTEQIRAHAVAHLKY